MIDKLVSAARLLLGTNQSSKPAVFNLADLGYTLKVAAVVGLGTGAVAALGILDAFDFGVVDAAVSAGVAWLVASVEAWQADNS